MNTEEKRTWTMLVTTVVTFVAYVVAVLVRRAPDLADTAYAGPLIVCIAAAVAVQILVAIWLGVSRRDEIERDERDAEITRFGERIGQSMIVIGGIVALILTMLEVDYFWIAQALVIGFFLSGLLDAMARLAAYREGLPW